MSSLFIISISLIHKVAKLFNYHVVENFFKHIAKKIYQRYIGVCEAIITIYKIGSTICFWVIKETFKNFGISINIFVIKYLLTFCKINKILHSFVIRNNAGVKNIYIIK